MWSSFQLIIEGGICPPRHANRIIPEISPPFRRFPSSSKPAREAVSFQISCKEEIRILTLKIAPQGKKKKREISILTPLCITAWLRVHFDYSRRRHRLVGNALPCPGFIHCSRMMLQSLNLTGCRGMFIGLQIPPLSTRALALHPYGCLCRSWEWKGSMLQPLIVGPQLPFPFCQECLCAVGPIITAESITVHRTLKINTLGCGVPLCFP